MTPHLSIRQHTSAYVSIAYVSIRQQADASRQPYYQLQKTRQPPDAHLMRALPIRAAQHLQRVSIRQRTSA